MYLLIYIFLIENILGWWISFYSSFIKTVIFDAMVQLSLEILKTTFVQCHANSRLQTSMSSVIS